MKSAPRSLWLFGLVEKTASYANLARRSLGQPGFVAAAGAFRDLYCPQDGHYQSDKLFISWVKRILQLAVFVLLVLWVPATMGCTLERISLCEWFCCDREAAADHEGQTGGSSHPVGCAEGSICDLLESGLFFKSQKIVKLTPAIAGLVVSQPRAISRLDPDFTPSPSVSPPVPDWLFFQRAVLPVRAPSLAS